MTTRLLAALAVCTVALGCDSSFQSSTGSDFQLAGAPATGVRNTQFPAGIVDDHAPEVVRMQQYLDWLHPPGLAVHSFERFGETIDCIPMEQQPALRGRAAVIATPPPMPAEISTAPKSGTSLTPEQAFFQGGPDSQGRTRACPAGTVQIRRWGLDDIKRWGSLEAWMAGGKSALPAIQPPAFNGHAYVARIQAVPNWGERGTFNIWNPFVHLSSEFSLVQLWVVGGSGGGTQTLEAGFQHYQDLYGDWRNPSMHFFVFSTQANYASGSNCYNSQCNFVVTSGSPCFGCTISPTSAPGGTQYEVQLQWQFWQGNWWLAWQGGWLGYFPQSRFNAAGLANGSNMIEIGSETAQGSRYDTIDMASGYYPSRGYGWAGYVNGALGISPTNTFFRPSYGWSIDNPACWDGKDTSDANNSNFLYGGIGSANSACTGP
jgi:hypothetical protein